MKINTRKLLLWLYVRKSDKKWVSLQELKIILPDLTNAGLNSIIYYLKQKHMVITDIDEEQKVSITGNGVMKLKQEISLLSMNNEVIDNQWEMIVFLTAPNKDKNFRYLRSFLVNEHAICISRGVYLYPGSFSESVKNLIQDLYYNHVAMFSCTDWRYGKKETIIRQQFNLKSKKDVISGVSKNIKKLLIKKSNQKKLTNQQKHNISTIYNQLFEIAETEIGMLKSYYPQVKSLIDLISQLQSILD